MTEFKSPLDGALYYAKHGLPVFPVRGNNEPDEKKAKHPVRGFTDWEKRASTDEKQIRAWAKQYPGCNWGFPAGRADIVVVDLDRKPGRPDGFKSFEEWKAKQTEPVPEDTFTVGTPSGGLHLYYSAKGVSSCNGFLPSFDIKSVGGYVLVPGSVVNGKKYAVTKQNAVKPLPASVKFSREEPRKDAAATSSPASSDDFAFALDEVMNMKTVPCGQRSNDLYALCASWRQRGIGHAARVQLLLMANELGKIEAGEDPLTEADFRDISKHTDRYAREGFGSSSLSAMFGGSEGPVDWKTFADKAVPERDWLIQDWLLGDAGTVVLFSGQGGTGKSLIALMLAHSLATGTTWLGKDVKRRAKSLVVTCEDSADEIARRIQRIEASRKVHLDGNNVRVWCRTGKDNTIAFADTNGLIKTAAFFKELGAACRDFFGDGGGLLILDTLADFAAINENDRTQVSQLVKHHLSELALEQHLVVVILTHPNKTNTGFSGSSAWEGAVRIRWELAWKSGSPGVGPVVMKLAKSNASMAGSQILLQYGADYLPVAADFIKADFKVEEEIISKIDEARKAGEPYGLHPKSKRPVSSMTIKHPETGANLDGDNIVALVDKLITEHKIESRTLHGKTALCKAAGGVGA